MHSVQLQAGALSVSLQTDADVDLNTAVTACHTEMHWLMTQWATFESELVRVHPEFDYNLGG